MAATSTLIMVMTYRTNQVDRFAACPLPRPIWYPVRILLIVEQVADNVPDHGIETVDNAEDAAIAPSPRRPTSTVVACDAAD